MSRRALRARFRGSALGLLWPLIHPFCRFWVYLLLFSKILQVMKGVTPEAIGVDVPADLVQHYYFAMYLFSGILMWNAFGESLQRNATSIVANSNLIKKMAFPSEVIPLSEVFANTTILFFATVVFLGFMYIGGLWIPPTPGQLLIFPLLIALQVVFTYGLSLIVATLHVFLRDTAHILTVVLTFWMFLTPIFWDPRAIIKRGGGDLDLVIGALNFNPMYHMVNAYRDVLIHPGRDWTGWDTWHHVVIFAIYALVFLWLGTWFFNVKRRRFADEV